MHTLGYHLYKCALRKIRNKYPAAHPIISDFQMSSSLPPIQRALETHHFLPVRERLQGTSALSKRVQQKRSDVPEILKRPQPTAERVNKQREFNKKGIKRATKQTMDNEVDSPCS